MHLMELPEEELVWRFETSGGPGGQHANRSATRAVVTFDVAASRSFDDATKERIISRLGSTVVVEVDESRSQWRNRQTALARLVERLEAAAQPPPPPRRATRPSAAERRRRVEEKRRRAERKRLRRPPADDQ
jgi:ribosome-associated protein